jgi:hypothetical protein
MKEKRLRSKFERDCARRVREAQWEMMERAAKHDPLWFCIWNKRKLDSKEDELRCCLMSGMDRQAWIDAHPDWFEVGEWSDERYAVPIRLTDVGRKALTEREKYDDEDHHGGLAEPGYVVKPTPKGRDRNGLGHEIYRPTESGGDR